MIEIGRSKILLRELYIRRTMRLVPTHRMRCILLWRSLFLSLQHSFIM